MTDKPTGGEAEYDLLAELATNDTADATMRIAADNPTWGICRCRMAAIIYSVTRRKSWKVSGPDAELRCLTLAKYANGATLPDRGGVKSTKTH